MSTPFLDWNTTIRHVTVFTDRAQVVRRGGGSVQQGVQELVLAGLPAGLEADSLRASGQGTVAVKILGVEAKERVLTTAPHPQAEQLRTQAQAIEDEIQGLMQQDAALQQRLRIVENLAENSAKRYAKTLASGTATLESARQLLDFLGVQTRSANEARIGVSWNLRDARKRLDSINAELRQYEETRHNRQFVVAVLVDAAGAGEWDLELTYTVPGASWRPVYDARLTLKPTDTGLTGVLSLGYGALLSQRTGEDWSGVHLTLSTARPQLGSLPPKLQPLYIDVPRPVMPMAALSAEPRARRIKGADDSDVAMEAFAAPSMAAPAPPPIQAEVVQAEVTSSGGTVTFELPYTMDVPADGQNHRSQIANIEFPGELDFFAVPRLVSLAYLRAKVTNTSELTLLEGSMNIFRDGVFVGKDQLKTRAPGEEFSLFLGPDDQVKTERELTSREVDKNFMGNQRRIHYGYAITLNSLKPYPVRLTVQDQIPVSRNESIKVRPRTPEPAPQISDLGVATWELTLPPASKRKLTLEYTVEAPRDVTVVGLTD